MSSGLELMIQEGSLFLCQWGKFTTGTHNKYCSLLKINSRHTPNVDSDLTQNKYCSLLKIEKGRIGFVCKNFFIGINWYGKCSMLLSSTVRLSLYQNLHPHWHLCFRLRKMPACIKYLPHSVQEEGFVRLLGLFCLFCWFLLMEDSSQEWILLKCISKYLSCLNFFPHSLQPIDLTLAWRDLCFSRYFALLKLFPHTSQLCCSWSLWI